MLSGFNILYPQPLGELTATLLSETAEKYLQELIEKKTKSSTFLASMDYPTSYEYYNNNNNPFIIKSLKKINQNKFFAKIVEQKKIFSCPSHKTAYNLLFN